MRIVIAEDLVLLRDGLERLLRDEGFDVVAAVGDATQLMDAVTEHAPDLAIVDVRLPPEFRDEGIRAALQLRHEHPNTAVLIVSQYVEPTYARELLADASTGGVGYLLKDRIGDVAEFVDAVRRVADRGTAIDPEVVAQLLGAAAASNRQLDELTPREREVLALMAEGRTNASIAAALVVTVGAVEKHAANIFAKLRLPNADDGGHRRVLAVLAWMQSQQ